VHARAVDGAPVTGIPQGDIGVGADGDRALARVQAEETGGVRRGQGDELVDGDTAGAHAL
jgi:hypothetical protein